MTVTFEYTENALHFRNTTLDQQFRYDVERLGPFTDEEGNIYMWDHCLVLNGMHESRSGYVAHDNHVSGLLSTPALRALPDPARYSIHWRGPNDYDVFQDPRTDQARRDNTTRRRRKWENVSAADRARKKKQQRKNRAIRKEKELQPRRKDDDNDPPAGIGFPVRGGGRGGVITHHGRPDADREYDGRGGFMHHRGRPDTNREYDGRGGFMGHHGRHESPRQADSYREPDQRFRGGHPARNEGSPYSRRSDRGEGRWGRG